MADTDAVIVSYARSPIGKSGRGSFRDATLDTLLAPVVAEAIQRASLSPGMIEECVFGNVLSPSGGFTEARMVALECGIPVETPMLVVNRQCGSGLDAVDNVCSKIKSGRISIGLAGGFELMSQNPMLTRFCVDAKGLRSEHARWCLVSMGETSEELARRFGISREDADYYACESQAKARGASGSGLLDREITPIRMGGKTLCADEGVRETDLEKLARLKPVFRVNGVSTAGNSSQLSDAAAAVVVMSRRCAAELGVPALGTFVDFVSVGCDPAVMGIGPSVAIPRLLEQNGIGIDDVDVFEINEAFSAQALYCIQKLAIPASKVNVLGGAVALGHPVGCTGARLVGTILNVMERRGLRTGVVSLCVGTGMGVAALIRRD